MFKKIISKSLVLIITTICLISFPKSAMAATSVTYKAIGNGANICINNSSGECSKTYTARLNDKGFIKLIGSNTNDNVYVNWANHNFLGWSTDETCSNYHAPGTETNVFKNSDTTDVTLYACWGDSREQANVNGDCPEDCNEIAPAIRIVKIGLIPIFQILIPVALIVMGMIDFAKAMMAQRDDEMKKAQGMFIKRCLYAVAVFFVVTIVTLIFNLFSSAKTGIEGADDWLSCWKVVGLNDDCTK